MTGKIRIYELAKEVKLEPKRIIEEARREGVDVSVPSNSVPKEVADKIRNKYMPKKEVAPMRGIKVIKKKDREDSAPPLIEETPEIIVAPPTPIIETPPETPPVVIAAPEIIVAETVAPVIAVKAVETPAEVETPEKIAPRILKPLVKSHVKSTLEAESAALEIAAAAEIIAATPPEVITETPAVIETAAPVVAEQPAATPQVVEEKAKPPISKVFNPGTSGPKKMVLNKAALQAGFRPGEKINIPQPKIEPVVEKKPLEQRPVDNRGMNNRFGANRNGGQQQQQPPPGFVDRRPNFLKGTPGETATPQTTYTPPPSNKKGGRNAKGNKDRDKGGRDNRFAEKDFGFAPKPLTLQEKIQKQLGVEQDAASKSARLVEGATVREFAEKLGIAPRDVVQLLIKRGIFATVNQPLNTEIAVDLGRTFGFDVSFVPFEEMVVEQEFEDLINVGGDDVEIARAPVVTVMGHVDHGKTSLLDAIRSENVAGGEAGGITQHIGAYSVQVNNPDIIGAKRRVVFLDTPGHEAFTMMRARGAKATDVVVLVVAADDGVMPQTIEAIEHSKAAGVPIIVAINKIDKPEANIDRVKTELSGQGLQPLDWGGDTEMVEVSAKKRENLDTLLETILLTSDILELKASPTRLASGVVLEAKLDRGRGAVATVLVQQGTLRVGDPFIVGNYAGKVRAMFSDTGAIVTDAEPATPIEVLGLGGVPQAGDMMQVVADVDRAQQISNQRQQAARNSALAQTSALGLESLGKAEIKELRIILKGDVQGSVEVIRATLEKLSTEKVKVKVIRSGVGAITESDVLLASATQAESQQTAVAIVGFNVRPESRANEVAKSEHVDIRLHSIIYKLEEEIRAAMIGMLDAIEKEVILGHALVQEVFKVTKVGAVAGCRVLDGIMRRTARARLIRGGVVTWTGELLSLKRFKDDASEVREGFECGIGLQNFNDIKVDDQIECFIIESIAATEL